MSYSHYTKTDFKKWERFYRASFFNSLGGYKSCNLIGSKSSQGIENLGLFFSVIHVGANPPLLGLLFRPHSVPRHTLENIRETQSFTVNAVAEAWHHKAHQAAANYQSEENEFEKVGLTAEYKPNIEVPFVKESQVKFWCSPVEEKKIEVNKTIFMVAAIEEVFVASGLVLEDGLVDHAAAKTVSVNALDTYYSAEQISQWEYPRPNQELKRKQ